MIKIRDMSIIVFLTIILLFNLIYSQPIDRTVIRKPQYERLLSGHIINKSNQVITVKIRDDISNELVHRRNILPGKSQKIYLRNRTYTFIIKSHPYGEKVGERTLTITHNKVFYSGYYKYWFIEYLDRWKVKANS